MLKLNFTPQSQKYESATNEYISIWDKEGERIIKTLQKISGLAFQEDTVNVTVYGDMSFAGKNEDSPMRMRAFYPHDTKKATLIHELCHRMLFQIQDYGGLDEHQMLNLFLYDTWVELYGKEFADEQVKVESKRKGYYDYAKTWEWTLSMTEKERQNLLTQRAK